MKSNIITVAGFGLIMSISIKSSAQIPVVTSWVINTTGAKGYNNTILSNVTADQFDSDYVYISCNSVPGYTIGPWGNDPNVPEAKGFTFKITRRPKENTGTRTTVPLGQCGIWSNGVAIYNAWDANTYNNAGVWQQNAYYFEGVSFDDCLGHPDAHGVYHHHVSPTCLYDTADKTTHSPIIGYAFDGYPIYGAYGYSSALNANSTVRRMVSSYQLRKMKNRDTLPNGTVASSDGPPVSTTYPLGDYLQDYQYIAGSGDLDTNNGRYCVTPDYPNGTYAYFVTLTAQSEPAYPYTLGLTYYGVVVPGNTGSGGYNTAPDSTKLYIPPGTTTGVSEVGKEIKFTIEPNPTKDYTYIYFDATSDNNVKATLLNTQGQILATYENWHTAMAYSINMTSYAPGLYFLHLQTSQNSVIQKIIKVQ